MRGSQLIQRPAEHAAKPGVDIAEGGLTRFEADKIGYHAAVNLTANAFHRAVADAGFICRQNVTGGGADNFHQRVGLRTRAHRTHMAVERAAGNGHVLRQTEAFRPLFAERADRNIGGEGVGKQRVCQVLLMIGSSSSKNVAGGSPQLSCHSDLCPALQRPRRISCGRVVPESRAGTQSHSSIHDAAACATDASARVTCRILAQNHSLE